MMDYTIFYCHKGRAYTSAERHSHYNDLIDRSPGRAAGNSRIWGDASEDVQRQVIDTLIRKAGEKGLTTRETAHVLAICHIECGFNPDAAAGTTSAAGLGQFIDSTGMAYGLNDNNRFHLEANADVLIRHFLDNKRLAAKKGYGGREAEEMIYTYHHDGPAGEYGGLKRSRGEIMPLVGKFEQALLAV
jgi:putative chitinase